MHRRPQRIGSWLWLGTLIACAAVVVLRLQVTTSMEPFWGSPEDARRGALSTALASSVLARTMVFTIEVVPRSAEDGRDQLAPALAAASELAERLRGEPEVAWIRDRVEPGFDEALYEIYFPRRFAFSSSEPETEIPRRFDDAGLDAAADSLLQRLARPTGVLTKRLAPEDPWGLFTGRMEALRSVSAAALELHEGRFVAASGRHAIVFLTTEHPPFDTARQAGLDARIERTITELESVHGVEIERSALHRFALASERAIRADIQRISIVSGVGVFLLLLWAYRSIRVLVLAFVPLLSGVIVACAVGLLVFGKLHGLTLAFGSTLIGVCVDYPAHFFTHHVLDPGARPGATLRRVWTGVALGGLTTVAGFMGLTWASFPGIREIGLFASVGVAAALLSTRWLVPMLCPVASRAPLALRALEAHAARLVRRASSHRRSLAWLAAVAVLVMAAGLSRVRWIDDARALNRLQPAMLQEDARVRDLVARSGVGRLVVAEGTSIELALQRNDLAHARLRPLVDAREVQLRSAHPWIRSVDLQLRNLEAVRARSDLASRTLEALAEHGFRTEAFEGLGEVVRRGTDPAEVEPLTLASLEGTPLWPVVAPHSLALEDGVAIVTFVESSADLGEIAAAVSGLDGVYVFDQSDFLTRTYRAHREATLPRLLVGLAVVGLVLLARYRSLRRSAAAFLPSLLAGGVTISVLALAGIELHLLHLVGLLLVLSMGVDYGVFLAESVERSREVASTIVGLAIACVSTVLAFGLLAWSDNPALKAVGLTVGLGVMLSLLFAPTTLIILGRRSDGDA